MFDPAAIKPFEVIEIPFNFGGVVSNKKFVVYAHENHLGIKCVLVVKATSKTERYTNDPEKMKGCVMLKKGSTGCFPEDTAIEPHNGFAIKYADLIAYEKNGRFKSLGTLPSDFKESFLGAINKSAELKPKTRQQMLARLGGESK